MSQHRAVTLFLNVALLLPNTLVWWRERRDAAAIYLVMALMFLGLWRGEFGVSARCNRLLLLFLYSLLSKFFISGTTLRRLIHFCRGSSLCLLASSCAVIICHVGPRSLLPSPPRKASPHTLGRTYLAAINGDSRVSVTLLNECLVSKRQGNER